jgi:carboxylesterase
MRLLGDYLHQRGLTVSAPLLPGHGTSVQDMNRCKWRDWVGHAGEKLADLRARCDPRVSDPPSRHARAA